MSLQSCHLVPLEDEAAHAAVELTGEQQLDHRGFDVLLLILVDVERVLQLLRDVVCKSKGTGAPKVMSVTLVSYWDCETPRVMSVTLMLYLGCQAPRVMLVTLVLYLGLSLCRSQVKEGIRGGHMGEVCPDLQSKIPKHPSMHSSSTTAGLCQQQGLASL